MVHESAPAQISRFIWAVLHDCDSAQGGGRGQGLSVPPLDTKMPASGAATLVTEIRLAPGDDEEAQAAILLAHTQERTHGI